MGQEKKPGFGKRLRQAIVHLFGGTIIESYDNQIMPSNGWDNDKYMFDFKPMFAAPNDGAGGTFVFDGFGAGTSNGEEKKKNKEIKIAITPKEALKELEVVPTTFSLANLDDKISVLKDKEKLIKQHYANREVKALLERLENRKKYKDYESFFNKFDNTTQEKVDALLKKTGLVMKESDIFIPEFPDDAIKVMKDYTETVEKLCGKKPVFYVIAETKDFKTAYEKRDPILLAQSPFGFYYQILGAWDEEMLLLSEL
jgi:hypothetical protein